MIKEYRVYCTRCGALLDEWSAVWLELDRRDGKYKTSVDDPSFSQGGFPFGKDCAKAVLR